MSQRVFLSHAEAFANCVAGIAIVQTILFLWGMAAKEAIGLNAVFFVASYLRAFIIRRCFARIR